MPENQTTDNQVIKLRLITFVGLIFFVFTLASTISGIIFTVNAMDDRLTATDNRISKTTGRNAEAIKDLHKELEEYMLKEKESKDGN